MTDQSSKTLLRDKLAKLSDADRQRLVAKLERRVQSASMAGTYRPQRALSRMDFSLFFFSSVGTEKGRDKYRLLLETVDLADASAIRAVWVPERHFVEFGGLFPNPSVLAAALAVRTKRLGIRAGSVVLPLHHPVRVAEEWAVVDNLSNGRVGMAFASGWHRKDFQIAPGGAATHPERRAVMALNIEAVRKLWRGEGVIFEEGAEPILTYPRPIQPELPIWIASQGSEETFVAAGQRGAGILTGVVGQSREDLQRKIGLYRDAAREASGGAYKGHVVAMLHSFIGEDDVSVKADVREPLISYLSSFLEQSKSSGGRFEDLSEIDRAAMLNHTFDRYYETNVLMGSLSKCKAMVEDMVDLGINEIACLIDFGLPLDRVLCGMKGLCEIAESYAPSDAEALAKDTYNE